MEAKQIEPLLRKFLFFYCENMDTLRLNLMCSILLENIKHYYKTPGMFIFLELKCVTDQREDAQVNLVYFDSPQSLQQRMHQLKTLLSFSSRRLLTKLDVHMQLILHLTNPEILLLSSTLPADSKRYFDSIQFSTHCSLVLPPCRSPLIW